MIRSRLSSFAAVALAMCPAAFAQYTAPAGGFDAYHGLNGVSCKNPNTAFTIA
jgi:hypothetical protein